MAGSVTNTTSDARLAGEPTSPWTNEQVDLAFRLKDSSASGTFREAFENYSRSHEIEDHEWFYLLMESIRIVSRREGSL